VESFLQNAQRILETAVLASNAEMQNCTICVSHAGTIHILTDNSGWSLPGLAAEYGASALYAVNKRGTTITVEGWSPQETCLLRRDVSAERWFRTPRTVLADSELPWQMRYLDERSLAASPELITLNE
jgi:hypothetical protein